MLLLGLSFLSQYGFTVAAIIMAVMILALLSALTIHEFSHAYAANLMGDDTPRLMGRLTLNPFAHLELFGTIMMLLVGFGWGKPVIVNPRNFTNPKLDNLTVSLAGPISNLILAAVLGLTMRFLNMPPVLDLIFSIVIFFNLTLMIFNLLPIPPLDGSKVLALFLSDQTYLYLQQIGFYILIALIFFSAQIPVIPFIIDRVVSFFFSLFTGQAAIF